MGGFVWVVVDFLWVVMATEQWGGFFPSYLSGFCVGGGGLLFLSLVVVVGGWLGLTFSENRFYYIQDQTQEIIFQCNFFHNTIK